jgi:uncharacterized protein YjbI with pentapeptide repeats
VAFEDAVMQSAKFEVAILEEANFSGAILIDSQFIDCDLSFASFTNANGTRASFTSKCKFNSTKMVNANFGGQNLLARTCQKRPSEVRTYLVLPWRLARSEVPFAANSLRRN